MTSTWRRLYRLAENLRHPSVVDSGACGRHSRPGSSGRQPAYFILGTVSVFSKRPALARRDATHLGRRASAAKKVVCQRSAVTAAGYTPTRVVRRTFNAKLDTTEAESATNSSDWWWWWWWDNVRLSWHLAEQTDEPTYMSLPPAAVQLTEQ